MSSEQENSNDGPWISINTENKYANDLHESQHCVRLSDSDIRPATDDEIESRSRCQLCKSSRWIYHRLADPKVTSLDELRGD